MSPMQTVDHLIRHGWSERKAIKYVKKLLEFPWGIKEDPFILERLEAVQ